MAGDSFRWNSNININFTTEIYNKVLIIIRDLCIAIRNKVPNQLRMPSPNGSTATSFDVELGL